MKFFGEREVSGEKFSVLLLVASVFRTMRSGNRYMKRLFVLISLNVAYSTAELCIGLLTGRVGTKFAILFQLIFVIIIVLYFFYC